jgi:hypothetical protein
MESEEQRMEQTSLAIVEDTPDVLKARLRREWEAIEARKEAGEVDYSVARARALTTYMALGLSYTQIAEAVHIRRGWIDQLLRYGRFMNFASAIADANQCRIAEGRFRQYWKETVDKKTMARLLGNGRKSNPGARLAYEQEVFQKILEKIMQQAQEPVEQFQGRQRATRQLSKKLLAQFTDGKYHLLRDIATTLEADIDVVRGICERIVTDGAFKMFGEKRPAPPAQGSWAYRFVKGGKKKIDVTAFYAEVKPVLDDMENVINGHSVDFSQQAMKLAFAEFRKVIDRVAR